MSISDTMIHSHLYILVWCNLKGVGNVQFHVALSNGVTKIGPKYKAASVRVNRPDHTTWLTARADGHQEILDGRRILDDINHKVC